MEDNNKSSLNTFLDNNSTHSADKEIANVIKSDSNELNDEKCCVKTATDIEDFEVLKKDDNIDKVIDDSKESLISSDSKSKLEMSNSSNDMIRKKFLEVQTYSTELPDDKDSDSYTSQNTPSSASTAEFSLNFSFPTNDSTTSPIANVQKGSIGSVPRPPRPSASFCRLDVSTDLNLPPSNWLNVDPSCLPPGLAGFDATPHYSGFSSFRMASLFLDYSSRQR